MEAPTAQLDRIAHRIAQRASVVEAGVKVATLRRHRPVAGHLHRAEAQVCLELLR
jgi:hypothetical protein